MKNIRNIAIILFLCVLCSCVNSNFQGIKQRRVCKELIDSLKIQNLVDKSKWAFYCLYGQETLDFVNDTNSETTISFSSLDLNLDTVTVSNDSIEIFLHFYYNNSPCNYDLIKNPIAIGVLYTFGSDTIRCYSGNTIRFFCPGDQNSRYVHLEQDEVINYINQNKNKLNPWFLKEAEKKGLIK